MPIDQPEDVTIKVAKATGDHEYHYKKEYEEDSNVHFNYVDQNFDPWEAMLQGIVYDSVSKTVDNAKVTDSYTSTLAIERAARVVGKLPDGLTEATAKADQGKAAFMDILRQKWVYPNANAQRPFLVKLRLWQLYSSVYGYMPMFYDWNASSTGYLGPDCWLWNPRNLIPQQGRVSISDMDYVTALTWVGKSFLQGVKDRQYESILEDGEMDTEGWNLDAVQLLLDKVEATKSTPDTQKDTLTSRERTGQAKKGICLATRYEAGPDGEWITFAPDHGYLEVRRIPNPHKNGRIPFVIKYSQPLFDSFYGMGDFQRAKPLQFARDGLTNFYFASLKRNLSPGIIANANGVVKSTLDVTSPNPVLLETIPNSIRPMPTNTAGLNTYQGVQSNLTGSLLSLFGSQNASMPGAETLNPSQGKTPAAIDLYNDKEATRDGQERTFMEVAIEELTDGFNSMIVNIGTEDIPVNLFSEDLEDIRKAGLIDILDLFEHNFQPNETLTGGELRINPDSLRGVEYRFSITPNSTAKVNREKQRIAIREEMDMLGKYQNIFKEDQRVQIHWDKISAKYNSLSDVQGGDEFITVAEGPSPQEVAMQQQMEEMQQQMQELQQQLQQKEQEAQQNQEPPPRKAVGGTLLQDPELASVAEQVLKM